MMKILRSAAKLLISSLVLCSSMSLFGCSVGEKALVPDIPVDPQESIVLDTSGMLSDDEITSLTDDVQDTAEYIDMNVLVFVSGNAIGGSDRNTQMFCEEVCLDNYDKDADSVVLYLDLAGHGDTSYAPYDFIYTRNRARFYYPSEYDDAEDRISAIFSTMNPYLPRGDEDPYTAVGKFLEGLERYYDKGASDLKYFYVADTDKYITMNSKGELKQSNSRPKNWGMGLLIGLVVSFIVSIITFFCIKSHYKFKTAPSSLHYIRSDNMNFNQRSDVFIRKYQIRTKRETSSSSGGGGGGGGSTSSGGGGGGNHR